jgi:transglutaminase-like putative cysteine protease
MMTTSLASAAQRLRPAPSRYADYDTPPDRAAGFLRVPVEEVLTFADAGVPFRRDAAGTPLFEFADIYNLAALSGAGRSLFELGLRFLMRFAAEPPETWYAERDWSVKVVPQAGAALLVRQPDGDCVNVLRLDVDGTGGAAATGVPARPDYLALPGTGLRYRVRLRGRPDAVRRPEIADAYAAVFDALVSGAVSYQTVPERLRTDATVAWDLGMADCVVAAKVLAQRLREAGHQARARRGYLLGLLGSDHAWTEVHEDGRWKQLDPVAGALATGELRDLGFRAHPDFLPSCRGSSYNRFLPCRTTEAEPLLLLADETAPQWITCAISASPAGGE